MLLRPGGAAPGRLGDFAPHPRGRSADRRCAERRTVAALRLGLSLQRKGSASPSRGPARLSAPHRGVFLRPRDRLLETDRGAHSNALDSTGFPPLSSAPPARCRTDPHSWAGRCLPKPPEARLARPNPQAPHPTPPTSATG